MSYVHLGSLPDACFCSLPPVSLRALSGFGQQAAPPKLSTGEFGVAMARGNIPADVVRLLLLSKTFRDMAKVLDKAYVAHDTWEQLKAKNSTVSLSDALRILGKTSLKGRRVLYVGFDEAGSLFVPGQSIESAYGADTIRFRRSLTDADIIPWVEAVAHESAHAFARVTAKTVKSPTSAQRVRDAVDDECATRRREQKVIAQIRRTNAGRKALANYTPGRVHVCDCERGWFPSAQKRTYLEQFVLGMDWEVAATPLDSAAREKVVRDVATIPILKPGTKKQPSMFIAIMRGTPITTFSKRFSVLQSPAGRAAFALRLVDASWRQLTGKLGETGDIWLGARERRLERHRRLFFGISVGYTKCP